MKNYNQIAGFNRLRIDAISDGVFAIALTILVLDIKVPIAASIATEKELWNELETIAPRLIAYFMSFLTLGVYWAAHSTQYHYITDSDRNLCWINLFFLLFVSVIPFTTAFLSEYITFKLAIGIYWLNLMLLGVMLGLNWIYANKTRFISLTNEEKEIVTNAIKWRFIGAHTMYTLAALLCFISTYVSIIFFIIIQLNFALALISRKPRPKLI